MADVLFVAQDGRLPPARRVDDEEDDDEIDDAEVFVEVKTARFLTTLDLPLPDELAR